MLFEVMERKIWNKSASDSAVLRKLYETNKAKYQWDQSADVIMFNAPDKAMAEAVRKSFTVAPSNWRNLPDLFDGKVLADSNRLEWSQIPADSKLFANGFTTSVIVSQEDQSASFYHMVKLYPQRSPKSFDDAKGQLLNDYQLALEDKWVAELKKKYPVKVNSAVLDQVIRELKGK